MISSPHPRRLLALCGLALAAVAVLVATGTARADGPAATTTAGERLVIRGEDTVGEPECAAGVCRLELTDGRFRGTPVGNGDYAGTMRLRLAEPFSNGEGGLCAPVRGEIVLGGGTPDRLVLAIWGASCQDGDGDLTASSFTGLTRFTVKGGTGAYAHATGRGVASFVEDAADRERMTLIGRIAR